MTSTDTDTWMQSENLCYNDTSNMDKSFYKSSVFFIDPQSLRNMAEYDYHLLANNKKDKIVFYCSKFYDFKPIENSNIQCKPIFKYTYKKNRLIKLLSYVFSYVIIAIHVLRYRPRAIHVQWFRIPAFDYRLIHLLKSLFKIKFIFTAHNILPHDTGDQYKKVFQKTYNIADAIIVHAESTKEELSNLFHIPKSRISVILHGLLHMNVDNEQLKAKEASFKEKYNTNGKIVFTSLGLQNQYKGSDIIVDVWSKTKELNSNPHCCLIIAGMNKGVDTTPLNTIDNAFVEERLISNEEFYYLMQLTDVYLLPYRKISQSGALLTAITFHTPVLVSQVGGIAEPLDIARIGWKMEKPDFQSLQEWLLYLVKHPQEIKDIKTASTEWGKVERHFNWSNISEATSRLYNSFA